MGFLTRIVCATGMALGGATAAFTTSSRVQDKLQESVLGLDDSCGFYTTEARDKKLKEGTMKVTHLDESGVELQATDVSVTEFFTFDRLSPIVRKNVIAYYASFKD